MRMRPDYSIPRPADPPPMRPRAVVVLHVICGSCGLVKPMHFDEPEDTWGLLLATMMAAGWRFEFGKDRCDVRQAACPACAAAGVTP